MDTTAHTPNRAVARLADCDVAGLQAVAASRTLRHVALPRSSLSIAVRYGGRDPDAIDVHAMGVQRKAHRKTVHAGQRVVFAHLSVGAVQAALGVPAAAVAGRPVDLAALWGAGEVERLLERFAGAADEVSRAAALHRAITRRVARAGGLDPYGWLVVRAAQRLETERVSVVADALGVSERHFRRVFRDAVGVGPKSWAKLRRFERAVQAARASDAPDWSSIAVDHGYYDQAHLIADFRAIADATPTALLAELRAAD